MPDDSEARDRVAQRQRIIADAPSRLADMDPRDRAMLQFGFNAANDHARHILEMSAVVDTES